MTEPVAVGEAAECIAAWRTLCAVVLDDPAKRTPLESAIPHLLDAVEAALGRHKRSEKPVVTRNVCSRHMFSSVGSDTTARDWQAWHAAVDACPDCTTTTKYVCVTCRHTCPDDDEWECAEYRGHYCRAARKGRHLMNEKRRRRRWLPPGWPGQLRYFSTGIKRDPAYPHAWRAWLNIGDFSVAIGTAVACDRDGEWTAGQVTRHRTNSPRGSLARSATGARKGGT